MLKPQQNWISIEPDPAPKTTGMFDVPDTSTTTPNRGTIIGAGPGIRDFPMFVKPGDRVLYEPQGGTVITENDKDIVLLRVTAVMAKI